MGGFSLAFESVGFKTIGFAEIDPYASAVLKKHWPGVPNYGDIRNVPATPCDVLTGGFPCQPFSVAGKQRGKSDDRWLWPAMLEVIERCRPAWIVGENVPGIIGMELDGLLSDLERIGYAVQAFVVPACAVDAKHRRDRVWIVANASGGRCGESGGGEIQQPRGSEVISGGEAVADADERRSKQCDEEQRGVSIANKERPGVGENVAYAPSDGREDGSRVFSGVSGEEIEATSAETLGGARSWPVEPGLGRVANGIPNRAHRLKCLGNSIVPGVAQVFAKAIYQSLNQEL